MPAANETQRPMIAAMLKGPGPAKYTLPSLTGKDIAYTMRPQYKMRDQRVSPGPKYAIAQHLNNTGTFPGRSSTFGNKTKDFTPKGSPGAAAYNITNNKPGKTQPAYTMRPKPNIQKVSVTPAPNVYELQSLTGKSVVDSRKSSKAAWSMTGRSDVGSFTEVKAKTPGPAKYMINAQPTKRQQPAYSMGKRIKMPQSNTVTPGTKYNIRKEHRVQGGTFGIKHSPYIHLMMS
eukprot:m.33438 g.33438  ORF g.33438 m.33438 type:complete len:232 (-) comp16820_c0_seq2:51-746(-)